MEMEVKKLFAIQYLQIPKDLFKQMPPKLVMKYRLREATETITELRAHPRPIRYNPACYLVLASSCRNHRLFS